MSKQERHLYEFGPYRLLPAERLLLRDGEPVSLTPKAFETLVVLVERSGRLVQKEELLNEVWAGTCVEESNVAQNIFALRRILGKDENGKQYIETVPKSGYRFLASVKVVEDCGEELLVQHHIRASTVTLSPLPKVALTQSQRTGTSPLATTIKATQFVRQRGWKAVLTVSIMIAVALVGLGIVIARLFLSSPPSSLAITFKLSRLLSGARIWSAAISPDGRHVAHVVESSGQMSIWVRQVATTTDLRVIPPDRDASYLGLTFSRNGDYLYYTKHARGEPFATLYRVPALGGASRKIATHIDSQVTTSPDGEQIAFVRELPGESVLMIAQVDGTGERRLALRQVPDSFSNGPRGGPSWSPDGRTIVTGVISLKGGYHGDVIAISVSDGTAKPLTSRRWYQVAQVAWLSDGTGLLTTARESSGAQIWHVSYPDGAVRKVTNDLNDYHGVSLTADSRTLVTVQYDRPSTIVFVPEKPTSASHRNTAGMNEGFYGLSWTPEGELVYACEASGNLDVWLMQRDGVTAKQLTTDSQHDSTPSVSPDGRSVVFVSYRGGGIPHIWIMNIDGSNQRQLTNQAFEATPSFTPDGLWVVYAVLDSGIWKVPAEGGQPVLITGGYVHTPSVSPDGSLVACTYRDEKPNALDKIALLPIAGGRPIKVLDHPEAYPSSTIRWTPDGRALVYVATRDGVSNLWTLPLDGTLPHRATNFTSDLIFNFAWSRDNSQLALARGSIAEHVVLIDNLKITWELQ